MARKPMVTRTFKGMECNVLCVDVERGECFNKEVVLPRVYKDADKLMKAVKEIIDGETEKAVQIVDTKEVETLYGMTEADFIKNAVVLDPETRKAIEDEAEAEDVAELEEE